MLKLAIERFDGVDSPSRIAAGRAQNKASNRGATQTHDKTKKLGPGKANTCKRPADKLSSQAIGRMRITGPEYQRPVSGEDARPGRAAVH